MLKRLIDATRRNHALEHGTVSIMLGRTGPNLRLVGRAVSDGFYIYGRVPTDLLAECAEEALTRFHRGDRKSTRLNSSHANISYAVFCLKKNKANHAWPDGPPHRPDRGPAGLPARAAGTPRAGGAGGGEGHLAQAPRRGHLRPGTDHTHG